MCINSGCGLALQISKPDGFINSISYGMDGTHCNNCLLSGFVLNHVATAVCS